MSQKDPVPLDANLQALAWARKLRAIAQTGLTFAKDQYDIERYSSIRQIAAEMKDFATVQHDIEDGIMNSKISRVNETRCATTAIIVRFLLLTLSLVSCFCISTAQEQTRKARIGYCASLAEIDAVKFAGFDYVELRTAEIAALSDADYDKLIEKLKRIELPVPVTYLFIPADIKLTGPHVNPDLQMTYVRKALDRVSKLGTSTVVLGSGTARRYPEGFSKEEAFRQLVDLCKRIGPEARKRGITIAIEPLRKEESNIINTVAEGLTLVKAVRDPNIQLNVDYYHLAMENEDPAVIVQVKDYVRHVHIANPQGRVFPLKWGEYNYGPFYESLRKIGYDKEISIEARTKDFQHEAPQAIAFLRRALAGAQ